MSHHNLWNECTNRIYARVLAQHYPLAVLSISRNSAVNAFKIVFHEARESEMEGECETESGIFSLQHSHYLTGYFDAEKWFIKALNYTLDNTNFNEI